MTLGLGVVFSAAVLASIDGCSSSSSIVGPGSCEAFCNKWYGSHCKNGPKSREECLGGDGVVNGCLDDRDRCPNEQNALIRCATVDGTIACETGTGKPKILGCEKQRDALTLCLDCDRFCDRWSGTEKPTDAGPVPAPCPGAPTHAACLASCIDPTCSTEKQQFRACASGPIACNAAGRPWVKSCEDFSWALLMTCLNPIYPFEWPPPRATSADLR